MMTIPTRKRSASFCFREIASLWNRLIGSARPRGYRSVFACKSLAVNCKSQPCQPLFGAAEKLERRDCPTGFSITSVVDTVVEGNAAEFQITMDTPSAIPRYVDVTSRAITAQLGTDYIHQNQRLVFLPGQTTKSFFIQSLVDRQNTTEGSETLRVFAKPVGGTPSELTAVMTINDFSEPTDYNIEFDFDPAVSGSIRAQFESAAERWEAVIKGDLPDVFLPNGQVIDDLLIMVNVSNSLPAGTIAEASLIDIRLGNSNLPADRNFSANGLPYLSQVTLSSADITAIGISNVIAHEIGHAIGFGSLWATPWINSTGTLVYGVGTYPNLLVEVGGGSANPVFIGGNARREYTELFNRVNVGVPLYATTTVPAPYFDGSWGVHWRDSVFNNYGGSNPYGEIMTAEYPVNGINGRVVPYTISTVTVGALDDLGYTVDYAAAEPYSPPPIPPTGVPLGIPSTSLSSTNALAAATISQIPSRVLPPRITFPDRPPQILENDPLSREVVRASLEAAEEGVPGLLNLTHLNREMRTILTAWATYATPNSHPNTSLPPTLFAYSYSSGSLPENGPSLLAKKLFASLVLDEVAAADG